ncbi:MAG: translation initiation factor IF-2 [Clostridiales bacterium]|jgi:translation initiation factor IF-2|nr:translation initiation factor IF-2 [Clostridiales bacterium]
MSDVVKRTDPIEHIKELKGFGASKLANLGARIRAAKKGLDETVSSVRERIAELSKIVEAERLKVREDEQKAADLAEALAKAESVSEAYDADGYVDAAAQEFGTPQAEKTEKQEKPDKAEKIKAKADMKKKVDEFFERQESGASGNEPTDAAFVGGTTETAADAEAKDRDTAKSDDVKDKDDKDKDAEKDRPSYIVRRADNDPIKRAQAEASMTTAYSSGGRGSFDRDRTERSGDYRSGYQGQRPQSGGYQGQRQQGVGYQGGGGYQGQRPQTVGGYQGQAQRQPFSKDGGFAAGRATGARPSAGPFKAGGRAIPPVMPSADARKEPPKKKTAFNDDKKTLTKKALLQKGYVVEDITLGEDDDVVSNKRYKVKRTSKKHEFIQPVAKIDSAVITTADIAIKTLSEKIGKTAAEIVKKLFVLGITKTINESVDFDTAELIAGEFGVTLTLKLEKTYEEVLENFNIDEELSDGASEVRPPVVTIMGHVDHGKTSLLDYIRKAHVAESEAGGITQHIGAYTITLNGKPITFIDTPGHEAFTAMRARGAQITDIAVLVVAADDGVMPQTVEAINHAKAAGVSIVVAINKIDKPAADAAKIKQQVSEHGLLPEEWGGDVPMINVSAKSGEGVQSLLENILTLAEFKELRANPKRAARGTIIEAKLDKGRGPVATVLVQNGTLKIADTIVAGTAICRVRAMIDDKGKNVREAGPSVPVSVLGFDTVPEAGENIFAVADEKLAKQVIGERSSRIKSQKVRAGVKMSLEDVYNKISEGLIKDLHLVVKADVQGSSEALNQALLKISNAEVRVNIIHSGVGAINESDIMLAGTSAAIVIGFNVRPDAKAKAAAERDGVEIKVYRIIYDAIEDIEKAIKGMLAPKFKEVILGQASVRQAFRVSGVGTVAGCMVTGGRITRSAQLRLLRDNVIIHEGNVASLKRFKEDAKEVAAGFECGIGITDYNDIKEGDVIEAFLMEKIND